MPSRYSVQIILDATREVVASWKPQKPETHGEVIDALCDRVRDKGAAGASAVLDDLCARVRAKGVGVVKTEAQVIEHLRAAWRELLPVLDAQGIGVTRTDDIREAWQDILHEIKQGVQ